MSKATATMPAATARRCGCWSGMCSTRLRTLAPERSLPRSRMRLARQRKCLAPNQTRPRTRVDATKKRRRQCRRNSSCGPVGQVGETRCGISAAGLSLPFGGAKRREDQVIRPGLTEVNR